MVMNANDLLFQYFFTIGAGLAAGVLTVVSIAYGIYRLVTRKKRKRGAVQDV